MSAWSQLPNAKHIDQVLADAKAHPDEFSAAGAAAMNEARTAVWEDAARIAAWHAARDAGRHVAWDAARYAARCAAWDTAGVSFWTAAWGAARSAITALVAWDHSSKYLTMTYQELNMWYQLNEDPAAQLLLPYLKAQELISQKIRA
jgi:hypothetical protein